ncbi:MAG: hypothetical protein ABIR39_13290 [Nocardioides sp.]|uniref:hypothetical protein n=1 Tax=Nocardioides sp. TaxID=35761 RepID=UPI0032671D91
MTEREDNRPSETRQILRMFGDDIGDELKFVALFLVVMVPAGLIGYLVNGSDGAISGAIAGAALVVVVMVLYAVRLAVGWLRGRSG